MSKSSGGRAAVLSVLLGGLGVGALAFYVKTTPQASHVALELRAEKPAKVEAEPTVVRERKPARHHAATTQGRDPLTVRLPAFGDDIEDMDLGKSEVAVPGGTDRDAVSSPSGSRTRPTSTAPAPRASRFATTSRS